MAFAPAIHVGVRRQIHDLDKLGAGDLARSPRGDVARVTGDPQGIQAVASCQGQEQPASPRRIPPAAKTGMHTVADVSRVFHDVVGVANPQIDVADLILLVEEIFIQ